MAKKGKVNKGWLAGRDADLLVKIAIVFTVLMSLLTFAFLDQVVETAATEFGLETTPGNWILLAVAWLFLALFAHVANKMSMKATNKRPMWGLLLVAVLFLITSRVESAVLVGIAAILYLYRAGKSKK